jgi:hypothetical protein
MLSSDIRYKSIYDEHRDKKDLQRFSESFTKIISVKFGDEVKYSFYGSKEEGSFKMAYNTYAKHNNCSIQLNMSFHYPVKYELITSGDEVYNDHDLEIILNNRSQLMYVCIKGLFIIPQGDGLGSYIMTYMIKLLKGIPTIKFITLTPKQSARKFWKNVGFVDVSFDHFDLTELAHNIYSTDMIYIIK